MKRLLPIIATLAWISTACAQDPTAPSAIPPAPIVDAEPQEAAPMPSALPGSPVPNTEPLRGGSAGCAGCGDVGCSGCGSSCAGGCIGPCQGLCRGDGLVGLQGIGNCPPHCKCLLCFPKRMWFSGAYMHTFARTRGVPPLVTTSPDATPRNLAGVLPGATVLFGDEGIGGGLNPGMKLELGRWMGDGHVGFAGRLLYTESDSDDFFSQSNGTLPILALPYFDPIANAEDAVLLAHPDVATDGSVAISYDLEALSTDAMLRFKIARARGVHLDLTGGYNFARVDDSLQLIAQTTDADNTNLIPNGTVFDINDTFAAENSFHGGSIGLNLKLCHGRMTVRGMSKLSVGNMHQELSIFGQQVITPPGGGAPSTVNNGVYAQESLIGNYSRDVTSFIPEASLQLGYRVTRTLELNVGYTMLYFTNVALAGGSIEHTVDLDGPGGPAPPSFNDTSLWLQGITIGGAYNF